MSAAKKNFGMFNAAKMNGYTFKGSNSCHFPFFSRHSQKGSTLNRANSFLKSPALESLCCLGIKKKLVPFVKTGRKTYRRNLTPPKDVPINPKKVQATFKD